MDIRTAWKLAHADAWSLRKQFSVVLEKTVRELGGTTCLDLDDPDPLKQKICSNRMFGTRLTELAPIKEAVATYTSQAAEKLRAQQSLCKRLRVSIRTGIFNPDEAKYANGILVELPYPTDDTRLLTKPAQKGIERVFREDFRYSKAEVLLLDLSQPNEITGDLFAAAQPLTGKKFMGVLDAVNGRWGRRCRSNSNWRSLRTCPRLSMGRMSSS